MLRPSGVDAELVLVGRGRDLATEHDGAPRVLATAEVEAVIDYVDAQRVTQISSTPVISDLDQLVGRSASTGFRAAIDAAVAGHDVVGHLVYQLLDDLPVATLISGYAPQHARAQSGTWADEQKRKPMQKTAPAGLAMLQQADLCAGWKAGGTIMQGFAENNPPVVTGPDAPSLDGGDDPLAWHELPGPLPVQGMRRRRFSTRLRHRSKKRSARSRPRSMAPPMSASASRLSSRLASMRLRASAICRSAWPKHT